MGLDECGGTIPRPPAVVGASARVALGREPLEVREADLDQRTHGVLEPGLHRDRERLLVALARLLERDTLLQAVVAGDEQLLDPLARALVVHRATLVDSRGMGPSAAAAPVRVLVADDHRLFAQALEAMLAGQERIECVGVAANGREAIERAADLRPDVVLMDISMPVLDGIEATRRLRKAHPQVRVVMLTGSSAEQDVARSRKAGATGYLTKDAIAASLVDAILEAAAA